MRVLIIKDRFFVVRAGEHISASPLTGKRVHNNKKSSVKDHCFLSCHVCSFDDFTVLNYESHEFKHLIKSLKLESIQRFSIGLIHFK